MKISTIGKGLAALGLVGLLAAPAMAGTGNGAPAGPHYNLNIIGVDKGKNPDMTGNNGHRIFVPLGSKDQGVKTKIWLEPADDFQVCDANGFDEAHDCDGNQIAATGATFGLPCNNNLDKYTWTDPDGNTHDLQGFIGCNEIVSADGLIIDLEEDICGPNPNDPLCNKLVPEAEYEVWARALGAPNGEATITTCATVQDSTEFVCSLENVVLTRSTSKSSFTDVTNELTSLVVEYCWKFDSSGNCTDTRVTRIALFAGDTEDWFWEYDNKGLRLAQLRFYYLDDIKN